jgi:hypothetical protein
VPSDDTPLTKRHFEQIAQLTRERDELQEKLKKLIEDKQAGQHELEKLNEQLVAKDDQIHTLLIAVTESRVREATMIRKPVALTNAQVTAALATAQKNLEGCFDEWSSRPEDPTEWRAKATGEIEVERDGSHTQTHGVLSDCVEGAVARVGYPTGAEGLDLEVQVVWTADMVNTSARVVGRHEVSGRGIDVQ